MFKRLSNKRKVTMIILFIVLVLFVFFKTSVRDFGSIKDEISKLTTEKETNYQQLSKLQNTISLFESDSSLNALLSDSLPNSDLDIMAAISQYIANNDIEVYLIEQPIINNDNAIPIITYRMHFTGSYFEGIKLAYYLEQVYAVGRIASLNFHFERAKRSRSQIFITSIYYQISSKHENI
jgi:hypothetical protein